VKTGRVQQSVYRVDDRQNNEERLRRREGLDVELIVGV
jgi:hypothetical protein